MPKLILVPVNGTPDDAPTLATALAAARLFDAHLVGLHARPDIRREIALMASPDMGMGLGVGLDQMAAGLESHADAREREAASAWVAFCTTNAIAIADAPGLAGLSGEWRREDGDIADLIVSYGRSADLIVAGRARDDGVVGMDVLEGALMHSGRPLLVAPDQAPSRLNGKLVIAWKDTRESARAVAAALPFIARAESVMIMTAQESADTEMDPSVRRLARALRWHNPNVEVRSLPASRATPVETLLAAAKEVGAGLLVMGGYGHTRLREAVFGGFTRAVLESAPLPVLMTH